MTKDSLGRLMAVEVWFLQKMLKISRTEKKSNEEVFKEAKVHRTLMKKIRQRQLAFLWRTVLKKTWSGEFDDVKDR